MKPRSLAKKLAAEYASKENPLQWFEILYSKAKNEGASISWDDQAANPNLVEFSKKNKLQGNGRSALNIGSGFGHDAEFLDELGFQVTGFDLAPSAIEAAKVYFPESRVGYFVEDLFNLPNRTIEPHDFVLEAYTLQAMPEDIRQRAIPVIASLVKPGGELLIITRGKEEGEPISELPYPLTKLELLQFERYGLKTISFEDYIDQEDPPLRRFRAYFEKGS